jgi:hypothetical protein
MLLLTVVAAAPLVPAATAVVASAESAPVTENLLALIGGAIVAAGTVTAIVLVFFMSALSKNRALTYEVGGKLSNQITTLSREFRRFGSRHNREDDDRFDFLKIQQWQLSCKIAKIEGQPLPVLETFPRRQYLDEEDGPVASDLKLAGIAPLPDSS